MAKAPGWEPGAFVTVAVRSGATYGSGVSRSRKIKSHLLDHVANYATGRGEVKSIHHHPGFISPS
jgi:hypothetical protein